MRTYLYIIALLALMNASCTKDVLDKKPLNIISDEVVWRDPVLMDLYLNGVYTELTWFLNDYSYLSSPPGDDHSYLFTVMDVSDEAMPNWYTSQSKFKTGSLSIGGGLMEWWGYPTIRKINEYLERVPASPYEAKVKEQRLAEARFLRAFSYFALVKRYGGVPLITKTQSINDPEEVLYPKREKEEAIYNFILSEIDAIAAQLPDTWGANDYGRPTKYAALALKSRAAMYAASIAKWGTVELEGIAGIDATKADHFWNESYKASNDIITSKLFSLYEKYPNDKVTNYRNIFLDEKNVETIFSKQYTGKGGTSHEWEFFQIPKDTHPWGGGQQSGVYLEMVEAYEYKDGTPGKLDKATLASKLWTMDELWGNKDPRFKASIYTQNSSWKGLTLQMYNGIIADNGTLITSGSYNGLQAVGNSLRWRNAPFGVMKFLDETGQHLWNNYGDNDWLIFRYAEILLNQAEAAMELNKPDEALKSINLIRKRAGIVELQTIDREKIRNERKVELAFEGHRYWDVRRWRTATVELSRDFKSLKYTRDNKTGKFRVEVIDNVHGNAPARFYLRHYYFPITSARRANNPKLIENPHY